MHADYPTKGVNIPRRSTLLAAEQGFAEAQYQLGYMYQEGLGVAKDYGQSLRWYRQAANKGRARAQAILGAIYANGLGVEADYVQAHLWWSLAAGQGHDGAINNLAIVATVMTAQQLEEAKQLARAWNPDSASITVASPAAERDFQDGLAAYHGGD